MLLPRNTGRYGAGSAGPKNGESKQDSNRNTVAINRLAMVVKKEGPKMKVATDPSTNKNTDAMLKV